MTVYIIDNNRSYSCHSIYFVEPTSREAEAFETFWTAYEKAWPFCKTWLVGKNRYQIDSAKLVAVVRDADWIHSERLSAKDLLGYLEHQMPAECCDVAAAKLAYAQAEVLTGYSWAPWPTFEVLS